MSEALLMLRLEHRNTVRLLDCLDNLALRTAAGQPMDYAMASMTMNYFQTFPELHHHPKEDLVYAALVHRHPGVVDMIGDLSEDHKKLSERTLNLAELINSERLSQADGRRLVQPIKDFSEHYRDHMGGEEKYFFSAADRLLDSEAWAEIEFKIFDSDDPLFQHTSDGEFAELRQRIARMDAAHRTADQAMNAQKELIRVQDVRDFNTSRRDHGDNLRLVPFVKGGYGIERDGHLLAHLPPCSESRAAWCAHMFAAGEASAGR